MRQDPGSTVSRFPSIFPKGITSSRIVWCAAAATAVCALLAVTAGRGALRQAGERLDQRFEAAGEIVDGTLSETRDRALAGAAADKSAAPAAAPAAPGVASSSGSASMAGGAGASVTSAFVAAPRPANAQNAPAQQTAGQALPPLSPLPLTERMIVKNGTLTLEVATLGEAMQRVDGVVAAVPGAYIAASSTSYRNPQPLQSGGTTVDSAGAPIAPPPGIVRPQPAPTLASLTIKVPSDQFGEAMRRLRELGTPLAESISTQEITEEYVDLDAQVRNLEATEQQYLRFLDRAQRLEEVLPIQQRITEVRAQIERLRGRMTLLQRRSDVSTISLSLVIPGAKNASTLEPRAVRTIRNAFSELGGSLSGLLDVAIYLGVYALPLAPLVLIYLWWRTRQRISSPSTLAPATPATPATGGTI